MKVRALQSAMKDLAAGRSFYEHQGAGLGDYFYHSLFAEIDSLAVSAGIHPGVFGYHRLLAQPFPYAIYYNVTGDAALVYRVLDCRQSPRTKTSALGR